MCIIGAARTESGFLVFKQLDLREKTRIFEPEIRQGRLRYLAFSRENSNGVWAGVNEKKLAFVAADAETEQSFSLSPEQKKTFFALYESILANCDDIESAEKKIRFEFENNFRIPDIVAFGDDKRFVLLKFFPPNRWERDEITNDSQEKHLFCTNHFWQTTGGVLRADNESTFLRLEAANKLFDNGAGPENILKSHQFGPGEKSICRHGEAGEFFTQATVIFEIDGGVKAKFVLNNTPCKGKFRQISPFA